MHDNKSQHQHFPTLNAIGRFNIYPECVPLCVCVCVRERERERERASEREIGAR